MRPNWIAAGFLLAWVSGAAVGAAGIGWAAGSAMVGITIFVPFFVIAYSLSMWGFWRGVPALRADLVRCFRGTDET